MANREVELTLDDCVAEVLSILTGLDLSYDPRQDRYAATTRAINRALRANALEREWSYYSDLEEVGKAHAGDQEVNLRSSIRPRIINDDAVRLCTEDGRPVVWAHFLPRDALSKYVNSPDLRVSVTRSSLQFSRRFSGHEEGLTIQVPVMREPKMFRLPTQPEDPSLPLVEVPRAIREQTIDFDYPDVVIVRAAWYVAQSDPVMQPRAQTLEAQYKDLMYQLIERDERFTDSPYQNEFILPMTSSLDGYGHPGSHGHPHADSRVR